MIQNPDCIAWDWLGTLFDDSPTMHAQDLLELFYKNNKKQCIITNGTYDEINDMIIELNWSKYFQIHNSTHLAIVGKDAGVPIKPNPHMLLHGLKLLDITPNPKVIFIGDSTTDMLCARQANCSGILIKENLSIVWDFYSKIFNT